MRSRRRGRCLSSRFRYALRAPLRVPHFSVGSPARADGDRPRLLSSGSRGRSGWAGDHELWAWCRSKAQARRPIPPGQFGLDSREEAVRGAPGGGRAAEERATMRPEGYMAGRPCTASSPLRRYKYFAPREPTPLGVQLSGGGCQGGESRGEGSAGGGLPLWVPFRSGVAGGFAERPPGGWRKCPLSAMA